MPYSIIEFYVIGSDLRPLSSELIYLAQLYIHERAFQKLHFHLTSVYISVAERKLHSVLCGQIQQSMYMKNPVFGGCKLEDTQLLRPKYDVSK